MPDLISLKFTVPQLQIIDDLIGSPDESEAYLSNLWDQVDKKGTTLTAPVEFWELLASTIDNEGDEYIEQELSRTMGPWKERPMGKEHKRDDTLESMLRHIQRKIEKTLAQIEKERMRNRFKPLFEKERRSSFLTKRSRRADLSDDETTALQVLGTYEKIPGFHDALADEVFDAIIASPSFRRFVQQCAARHKLGETETNFLRKHMVRLVAGLIRR